MTEPELTSREHCVQKARHGTSFPLSLQQLAGAAERLRQKKSDGPGAKVDWLGILEEARDRLAASPFQALPIPAFMLSQDGKDRLITSPHPCDRLIEEALAPVLARAFEGCWRDSVHGYRAGRSTYTAARAASAALAQGRRAVALLDVADFYASIERPALLSRLAERLPAREVEIVSAFVSAPLLLDGRTVVTDKGLPLGRCLSPFLANLYVTPVDDAMESAGVAYVRYGDDVFLAAATAEERDAAETRLVSTLAGLGLSLKETKSLRFAYDGSPFLYLGHAVDHERVFERVQEARLARMASRPAKVPEEAAGAATWEEVERLFTQPNRRSQTLYVTQPGVFLNIEGGRVVVRRGRERSWRARWWPPRWTRWLAGW